MRKNFRRARPRGGSLSRVLAALVLICAAPAAASADDLLITGGYLDMKSLSSAGLRLEGDRGFTFGGSTLIGISSAWETCLSGNCAPGTRLSLLGSWSGNDVVGTATLDGNTYTRIGSFDPGSASLQVRFSGSFLLPPESGSATVVAPFVFTGSFVHDGREETLLGSGVTTISLSWMTRIPGALANHAGAVRVRGSAAVAVEFEGHRCGRRLLAARRSCATRLRSPATARTSGGPLTPSGLRITRCRAAGR